MRDNLRSSCLNSFAADVDAINIGLRLCNLGLLQPDIIREPLTSELASLRVDQHDPPGCDGALLPEIKDDVVGREADSPVGKTDAAAGLHDLGGLIKRNFVGVNNERGGFLGGGPADGENKYRKNQDEWKEQKT